jgi:hypothetical protein
LLLGRFHQQNDNLGAGHGKVVSVPRRGFLSLLCITVVDWFQQSPSLVSLTNTFQSPEGDSYLFYLIRRRTWSLSLSGIGFSPPKGILCFDTLPGLGQG